MQRKSSWPGRVFLILSLAVAGCGGRRSDPPPPPPHAGARVRVACPDAFTRRLVEAAARGWQGQQQARVEVIDGEADPSADVWVLPASALARYASREELEPLPDTLISVDAPFAWKSLLPLYRERLLVWNHVPCAVPLIGDAPICCYRADFLADPSHQAAFRKKHGRPLTPPVTWQEFEQIAAYFAEANSGRPSLPPLPADDEALRRAFYTVAACYASRAVGVDESVPGSERDRVFSFHYDLKTGQPRLASPGFVHALELLRRLQQFRPSTAGDPEKAFAEGKAVFCLTQAWAFGLFQDRRSAVYDKVAVCRMPGGECYYGAGDGPTSAGLAGNVVPYLGSGAWLLAVPRSAGQREAAFSLLADLAGHGTSGQTAIDVQRDGRWAGGATRREQLEGRTRWDAFNLNSERLATLKGALRHTLLDWQLQNPALCLRTPDAQDREKELASALRQALQPEGKAAPALQEAAGKWAAARPPEQARAEYRRSLGLLAR